MIAALRFCAPSRIARYVAARAIFSTAAVDWTCSPVDDLVSKQAAVSRASLQQTVLLL